MDWSGHMQQLKDANRLNEYAAADGNAEAEPKSLKMDKGKGPVTKGHNHAEDTDEDGIGDMTEPIDPDINRVLTPQKQAVHA